MGWAVGQPNRITPWIPLQWQGLSLERLPVPPASWQRKDVKQRLALPKRTPCCWLWELYKYHCLQPERSAWLCLPGGSGTHSAPTDPLWRAAEPCLHLQGQPGTNNSQGQTTGKDKPQARTSHSQAPWPVLGSAVSRSGCSEGLGWAG